MKHAGSEALDQLETLLIEVRKLPLKEKSRGVFYRKSKPFLHFHEDSAGLFADLMGIGRFLVTTQEEQKDFLAVIQKNS